MQKESEKLWPKPFMPDHTAWDRPSNLQIGQLNLADYKRAMLCVNACVNMPDEMLKEVISGDRIILTDIA